MLKAKVAGDRLTIIATTKEDQEDLFRWVVDISDGEFHAADGRGVIIIGTAEFLLAERWRIDLNLMAPPGPEFRSALELARQTMGRIPGSPKPKEVS